MKDRDPSHLHPLMRQKVRDLEFELGRANIPLKLYEGARTPFRQAELFSVGRAPGVGKYGQHVTRAQAWMSHHQYGVAVDFVFNVNGLWTWNEPQRGQWDFYTKLAGSMGLRSLSFERPHVELPVSLYQLQDGHFPALGDESWESWLEQQMELWGPSAREFRGITHPGAPPMLSVLERPAVA